MSTVKYRIKLGRSEWRNASCVTKLLEPCIIFDHVNALRFTNANINANIWRPNLNKRPLSWDERRVQDYTKWIQVAFPWQTHHLHICQGEGFDRPNQTWSWDHWEPGNSHPLFLYLRILQEIMLRWKHVGKCYGKFMILRLELEACMGSTFLGLLGPLKFSQNLWRPPSMLRSITKYDSLSNSTYCLIILNYTSIVHTRNIER